MLWGSSESEGELLRADRLHPFVAATDKAYLSKVNAEMIASLGSDPQLHRSHARPARLENENPPVFELRVCVGFLGGGLDG